MARNDDIFGELGIVLCADVDSELETRLQASAPSPALVHVIEVPRLTADQTGDLALQMCAAMPQSSLPPNSAAIAKLVDDSDGLPAKIVRSLAGAATMAQAAATPTRAQSTTPEKAVDAGATATAVPARDAVVPIPAAEIYPPADDVSAAAVDIVAPSPPRPPATFPGSAASPRLNQKNRPRQRQRSSPRRHRNLRW